MPEPRKPRERTPEEARAYWVWQEGDLIMTKPGPQRRPGATSESDPIISGPGAKQPAPETEVADPGPASSPPANRWPARTRSRLLRLVRRARPLEDP